MSAPTERNAIFLNEMGIGPVWIRRAGAEPMVNPVAASPDVAGQAVVPPETASVPAIERSADPAETALPVIPAWLDNDPKQINRPDFVPLPPVGDSCDAIAGMDWNGLRSAVANCTRCTVCRNNEGRVFGAGDEAARWLFVAEAPGEDDVTQSEPLAGATRKLFDNMLAAMGLERGTNVYLTTVMKCRPTDGEGRERSPTSEEAAACLPYLQRQIELVQPTVIVALGKGAALALLGAEAVAGGSTLRGKIHRYSGRPLIATYHPDQLLSNPLDKKKAWADLCLAMTAYETAG